MEIYPPPTPPRRGVRIPHEPRTTNNLEIQIENIIDIAKEAGGGIMEVYEGDFEVEKKADNSPLTLADKKSNAIIISRLKALHPDIPFISEENKLVDYAIRKEWEYFWLIDPLDGTKEFIKRNGEFTVNIALVHLNKPVLGVIYIPDSAATYYAIKSKGSYKISDEASPKLIKTKERSEDGDLIVIGSRSHANERLQDFIAQQRKAYENVELISAGSSLKFCLVAEGRADIYPRFGPTMEWDTAAGDIIVEEAGGQVLTNDKPLQYNKESLLNPWFIVQNKIRNA